MRAAVAAQQERWALWTPVAFGGGCGLYFAFRSEPPLWAVASIAAVCAAAAAIFWRTRRRGLAMAMTLVAMFALGLADAKLREVQVAAPIAPAGHGVSTVDAWVIDNVSGDNKASKLLLAPVSIQGLAPDRTPTRMRVTLRGDAPAPGAAIRLTSLVDPPPAPASPGSNDFARDFYFESIGAVGLALGEVRTIALPPPPARLQMSMRINGARWELAQRIIDRIGPQYGAIVVAMTTGHRAWIRPEDEQSFRDAGLAHLLAIAGLHMGIVSGFAFFATRLLIAAWPWLALRIPGKKAAAVAGLTAIGLYLLASGASAPAERAAVTASVAFGAILLDRRAISFNSLAIAAFIILIAHPEQIVLPGFQMSFAAVSGLVALAEAWPHRVGEISAPWPIVLFQRFKSWMIANFMVSLVAGAATAPFAVQHFNRTSNYTLLANMIEWPISGFITMPCLALGAVLETVGWGGPLLTLAGLGVRATLAISNWVSSLPGADTVIPSAPAVALPVSFLGILFASLWRGRLRWLGLPLAAAVFLWPRPEPPLVWIASDGTNAVVRDGKTAVVLRPEAKAFAVDLWTKRRDLTPADPQKLQDRFDCDRKGCVAKAPVSGVRISGWWWRKPPPEARAEAMCQGADLVVFRGAVDRIPPACARTLVLDALDFERVGALELWRRNGRWLALTNSYVRGDRPWTRAGAPSGEDAVGR